VLVLQLPDQLLEREEALVSPEGQLARLVPKRTDAIISCARVRLVLDARARSFARIRTLGGEVCLGSSVARHRLGIAESARLSRQVARFNGSNLNHTRAAGRNRAWQVRDRPHLALELANRVQRGLHTEQGLIEIVDARLLLGRFDPQTFELHMIDPHPDVVHEDDQKDGGHCRCAPDRTLYGRMSNIEASHR